MKLQDLGWNDFSAQAWQENFSSGNLIPGRVFGTHRGFYTVWTESGKVEAPARGKLIRNPETRPVTGDWVAIESNPPTVRDVLPRRTSVVRKAPGEETVSQVLGANIDKIFIVAGLDRDFNPRRIERFLVIAFESGAEPVVVLNKSDVCPDAAQRVREIEAIARGARVMLTSALQQEGIDPLRGLLHPGDTAGFMGSSGVGKSQLINCLLGTDERNVGAIRESDGRGRHTTVGRDLLLAKDGWLLMDLPGVRAVEPWSQSGVDQTFADVEALVGQCRFRDCSHTSEPGCAIVAALESGTLDQQRYNNYRKLQADLKKLGQRQEEKESIDEQRRRNISRTKRLKHS
jgi:ribosome biogenesis GTPase / thiamine phosphate phosphatase